jgi:hypothetical protein
MALTYEERVQWEAAQSAALKKIDAQRVAAEQADAEWANLTRSFAPAEAVDAIADAKARLEAGTLPQADHDALVTSISARTRHIETPESAKAKFDAKLANARADNETNVDSLTDAQFDKLWESVR